MPLLLDALTIEVVQVWFAFILNVTLKINWHQCIIFRDTLTYLTDAFARSTLPFVWDDPTSVADVKQVAVDLANGAARGKSGGHQFPQTACLVTANFDIHQMEK